MSFSLPSLISRCFSRKIVFFFLFHSDFITQLHGIYDIPTYWCLIKIDKCLYCLCSNINWPYDRPKWLFHWFRFNWLFRTGVWLNNHFNIYILIFEKLKSLVICDNNHGILVFFCRFACYFGLVTIFFHSSFKVVSVFSKKNFKSNLKKKKNHFYSNILLVNSGCKR